MTPLLSPLTPTGVYESFVVPLPSWPNELRPQHLTAPLLKSAHVWPPPIAIAITAPPSPTTSTGVDRMLNVPSPSRPNWLNPQHFAAPDTVRAQLDSPVA